MDKRFYVKILSLILASALILSTSIMVMSALDVGSEKFDNSSLAPDTNNTFEDTPASFTSLEEKFGSYSTISEENGKSIISIYSDEQLAELASRKEKGEWLTLDTEEILYLLEDTKSIFSKYDFIRINGKTYYGYSYYKSIDRINTILDASFDPYKDIYDIVIQRIKPLHSAIITNECLGSEGTTVVYTGINTPMSVNDMTKYSFFIYQLWYGPSNDELFNSFQQWIKECKFGALVFNSYDCIEFMPDISSEDTSTRKVVWNSSMLPEGLGLWKYAQYEKSVVIELYNRADQNLITRICIDTKNNAEAITKIEQLWNDFSEAEIYGATGEEYTQLSEYVAKVYISGMKSYKGYDSFMNFVYSPDGDIDRFNFSAGSSTWFEISGQMHGIGNLTAYLNEFIIDYIE